MEYQKVKVPQYLHKPYQVLFFEVDELLALVLVFVLALFFGGIFWVLIIPFVYLLSYLKKRFPRGYIRHLFYALGLIKLKNLPTYFENEFFE